MSIKQINKYAELIVPKLIFEYEFSNCTDEIVYPIRDTTYGFTLDWTLRFTDNNLMLDVVIDLKSCTQKDTYGIVKCYKSNKDPKNLFMQYTWCKKDNFPLRFISGYSEKDTEFVFVTIEIDYDIYFNIQKQLSTLIEKIEDNFSDVTFILGGQNFKASKAILATRSPVFANMFKTDMLEKNRNIIEIHGDDPRAFKEMLGVIYTGPRQNFVTDNAKNLFILADKYQIEDLKIESARILEYSLNIDNVIDLLILATQYNLKSLKTAAVQLFEQKKKEIFQKDKYKQIYDLKDFQLIDELFRAML